LLDVSVGETLITILHTNDTHSQIDPLPANDKLYGGKGGVAAPRYAGQARAQGKIQTR